MTEPVTPVPNTPPSTQPSQQRRLAEAAFKRAVRAAGVRPAPPHAPMRAASAAAKPPAKPASPSNAAIQDEAARLTAKSAQSETGQFRDFLHRHMDPPDQPVYRRNGPFGPQNVHGLDGVMTDIGCAAGATAHAVIAAAHAITGKPQGGSEDQMSNNTGPCQLGAEWAAGGKKQQTFHNGDPALQELQRHQHIEDLRKDLRSRAALHDPSLKPGDAKRADYNLGGTPGVRNYWNDSGVKCFATGAGCERGNLTVAYIGSYQLKYQVVANDTSRRELTVQFHAVNTSDLPSLSHIPWVGYTQWWQHNVEARLKNHQTGPMSPTRQDFYWTEIIKY